jgi:mannobiose 2-epimerase
MTSRDGAPVDERKNAYGHMFAIFALLEYARATHDDGATQRALDTYEVVEAHFHDDEHGGWTEDLSRDWEPLPPDAPPLVEIVGLKSVNTHLHVMEAYAELARATGDPRVRRSLGEALDVIRRFYPSEPSGRGEYRRPDWEPAHTPSDGLFSYGHFIEYAWLRRGAEQVLGTPDDSELVAIVDEMLDVAFDRERGGLYFRGPVLGPPTDHSKVGWAQAETICALTEAAQTRPGARYEEPLAQTAEFVLAHVADRRDAVWVTSVAADGSRLDGTKAHDWRAGYHDVRATVKFARAFGPRETREP